MLPLTRSRNRSRFFPPFSPALLFAQGEQGAWYDPSDYSTLFTDSAGTTPVTAVEQFVGLMLDKSKGLVLGPEIVVNGSFSSGASWTPQAGWAISGGSANATATSGFLYQVSAPIVSNAYFEFTFTVSNYVSGTVQPYLGAIVTYGTAVSGNGTYTQRFGPGPNNNELGFKGNSFTGSIDNVSVKLVTGNHAFQTTSAKRPKLAARYNLLTRTEEFDDGVWIGQSTTITVNSALAPNGTLTADRLQGTTASWFLGQTITLSSLIPLRLTMWVKSNTGNSQTFRLFGTGSFQLSSDFTATADWQQFVFDYTPTNTSQQTGIIRNSSNGTADLLIWGADLRPASQATGLIGPTYQRVAAATVYDTAGFLPYLAFDGLSWSMGTNSINPGAVDKAQVFAGVRKLSDAAQGAVAEFSATIASNNGTFLLAAPDGATQTYGFDSKGTTQVDAVASSLAAPRTNVVTGLADIAGDSCVIRVDGAVADTETGDQGTGNFLTYPLFIGARNNAGSFFQGWLSSMIVRFGANLSQSQIEATESWVNSRTGAY